MRVKIGDTWHDSKDVPLCIQYSNAEREQINANAGLKGKYAQFPDGWGSPDEMRAWMAEPSDQSSQSRRNTP